MNIQKALFVLLILSTSCFAQQFSPGSAYDVCFTPGDDCSSKIINVIAQAKKQVLVQAYSFTSKPIASALVQARKRGVEVRVILDKSQLKPYLVKFFINSGVEVTVDLPAEGIAHNKIIIVDGSIVVGGGYNYTKSADKRNVENVTIITDAKFAQKYVQNWHDRKAKSIAVDRLS